MLRGGPRHQAYQQPLRALQDLLHRLSPGRQLEPLIEYGPQLPPRSWIRRITSRTVNLQQERRPPASRNPCSRQGPQISHRVQPHPSEGLRVRLAVTKNGKGQLVKTTQPRLR
jgi:hypothetical protein